MKRIPWPPVLLLSVFASLSFIAASEASIAGTISGIVRVNSQTGVAGVAVQLFAGASPPTGAAPRASTTTDLAGQYQFSGVADGMYTLVAQAPGQTGGATAVILLSAGINNDQVVQDFSLGPIVVFNAGISLVSVPYDYSATGTPATLVFGIPISSTGAAFIAGFDPAANMYLVYPTLPIIPRQVLPGRGYWIKEAVPTPLLSSGLPVSSPFDLTLQPGWNLVGDPFIFAIDRGTLQFGVGAQGTGTVAGGFLDLQTAIDRGLIGPTLWGYVPSLNNYQPAFTLQPFQGYWLFINPAVAGNQAVTVRFTSP